MTTTPEFTEGQEVIYTGANGSVSYRMFIEQVRPGPDGLVYDLMEPGGFGSIWGIPGDQIRAAGKADHGRIRYWLVEVPAEGE